MPVVFISEPTVLPLAHMQINVTGLNQLVDWVGQYRPECIPGGETPDNYISRAHMLFPHGGARDGARRSNDSRLTDNELLVELAGRSCYHSYGLKAGRKSNQEYIAHTQQGDIPHGSIMYHAKMTFFLAGMSRRVSHELIRHYVGADRDEEGSPSQESTRYTFHPGHMVLPPHILDASSDTQDRYKASLTQAYKDYLEFVRLNTLEFQAANDGAEPKGMDRKRIYEAAAGLLPMQAATSMMWTTNPVALQKLFRERCHEASDREFQRLATKWRTCATEMFPNLFPQQP